MVVICMHYSSIATDNWHVRNIGTTWPYAHTDGETMRKIATKYFLKEKRKLARDKSFYVLGTNPEPHPHHCTCQDHVQNSQASGPLWRVVGGLHKWTCMMSWGYCEALCSVTSQLLHNEWARGSGGFINVANPGGPSIALPLQSSMRFCFVSLILGFEPGYCVC